LKLPAFLIEAKILDHTFPRSLPHPQALVIAALQPLEHHFT
jgi:hypothetical protein